MYAKVIRPDHRSGGDGDERDDYDENENRSADDLLHALVTNEDMSLVVPEPDAKVKRLRKPKAVEGVSPGKTMRVERADLFYYQFPNCPVVPGGPADGVACASAHKT